MKYAFHSAEALIYRKIYGCNVGIKKAEQYIGIIRLFCSNQTPGLFRLFVNILFYLLIHIVCILYLLFCKNFFASSAKSAVTFLIFSSVIAFHPLCFGFISYSTDL